jgi:hypothetical protein
MDDLLRLFVGDEYVHRTFVASLFAGYVLALIAADCLLPVRPGRPLWVIPGNAALQFVAVVLCIVLMGAEADGLAVLAAGIGLVRNLGLWLLDGFRARGLVNGLHLGLLVLATHGHADRAGFEGLLLGEAAGLMILVAAFAVAIVPAGRWVAHWTSQWASAMPEEDRKMGLPGAGLLIGRVERALVLLFVLMQRYEAVGFLLAAKSVFRIGDLTNREERRFAEYIFVGTLVSFTTAIAIGLAVFFALWSAQGRP